NFNRKYDISGAQPKDAFLQALEKIQAEEQTVSPLDTLHTKDQAAACEDGNCTVSDQDSSAEKQCNKLQTYYTVFYIPTPTINKHPPIIGVLTNAVFKISGCILLINLAPIYEPIIVPKATFTNSIISRFPAA